MERIRTFLTSERFFIYVLVLFVVHALWWALTAIYPLPFDEFYHVGIIQEYATQWSPIITEQSDGASLYGDITRLPSYLYHYVMSFPYRFIDLFTDSFTVKLIFLRLINVAMGVASFVLFRKLLTRVGLSKLKVNATLFFMATVPIWPFLAAHVNYDNLLLVFVPLFLLQAWESLQDKKPNTPRLIALLSIGLIASVVKRTFLPIVFFVGLYVLVDLFRKHGAKTVSKLIESLKKASLRTLVLTGLLFVLGGGLFAERYIGNVVYHGKLEPDCADVHDEELCRNYPVWYRNNITVQRTTEGQYPNAASYTEYWTRRTLRGYTATFSHDPSQEPTINDPYGPIIGSGGLQIPLFLVHAGAIAGFVLLVVFSRKLVKDEAMRFFGYVTITSIFSLWMVNYLSYLDLNEAHGIQARYTLPVLPLILAMIFTASAYIRKWKKAQFASLLVVGALMLYAGGAMGYLVLSDDRWHFQNQTLLDSMELVREVTSRIIIN